MTIYKVSTYPYSGNIILYNKDMENKLNTNWLRSLEMTEPEEKILVKMATSLVDSDNPLSDLPAFHSLVEKICEPAPWDYDPIVEVA